MKDRDLEPLRDLLADLFDHGLGMADAETSIATLTTELASAGWTIERKAERDELRGDVDVLIESVIQLIRDAAEREAVLDRVRAAAQEMAAAVHGTDDVLDSCRPAIVESSNGRRILAALETVTAPTTSAARQ